MYEYTHGGRAIYENKGEVLDFSLNINPLGMPEGVYDAILNEVNNCTYYPDSYSKKLRESISNFEKVNIDFIFASNGASDIIFRLVSSIKPKKALVLAPTFSDYKRALLANGAEVVEHPLNEENGFVLTEDIIQKINEEDVNMVFLCNPNNPTGVVIERDIIIKILQCCESIYLVIDECFLDFVFKSEDYTMKNFLNDHSNLIILKAFTKVFAMPGIRLGYCLSSSLKLIDSLYYHGGDWAVSNLAQASGICALKNSESYLRKTKDYVLKESLKMKQSLKQLGFKAYDSRANFIFFKSYYNFNLYEALKVHKIFIRNCDNFKGLTNEYNRICISDTKNNERFIEVIKYVTS